MVEIRGRQRSSNIEDRRGDPYAVPTRIWAAANPIAALLQQAIGPQNVGQNLSYLGRIAGSAFAPPQTITGTVAGDYTPVPKEREPTYPRGQLVKNRRLDEEYREYEGFKKTSKPMPQMLPGDEGFAIPGRVKSAVQGFVGGSGQGQGGAALPPQIPSTAIAPVPRPRISGIKARLMSQLDKDDRLRDIAAWTMLGEAANQGDLGMAAVLHSAINRSKSGRYPADLERVLLQPKQYSAWNSEGNGGNSPKTRYPKSSESFKNAREVATKVLSGSIPDPTYGATHYWAPKAMVASGLSEDPYWADEEEQAAGFGRYKIGDHTFIPRRPVAPEPAPRAKGTVARLNAAIANTSDHPIPPADIPLPPATMAALPRPALLAVPAAAPRAVPPLPRARPVAAPTVAEATGLIPLPRPLPLRPPVPNTTAEGLAIRPVQTVQIDPLTGSVLPAVTIQQANLSTLPPKVPPRPTMPVPGLNLPVVRPPVTGPRFDPAVDPNRTKIRNDWFAETGSQPGWAPIVPAGASIAPKSGLTHTAGQVDTAEVLPAGYRPQIMGAPLTRPGTKVGVNTYGPPVAPPIGVSTGAVPYGPPMAPAPIPKAPLNRLPATLPNAVPIPRAQPAAPKPIQNLIAQTNGAGAQFLGWLNSEAIQGRNRPIIRAVTGIPQAPGGGLLGNLFGPRPSQQSAQQGSGGLFGLGLLNRPAATSVATATSTRPPAPARVNPSVTDSSGRNYYYNSDDGLTALQEVQLAHSRPTPKSSSSSSSKKK